MRDVEPEIGSLFAVGLGFGVIEHTGIYIGDGYIIEQHGDDVLKQVTFQEFIDGDKELYARGLNIGIQIAESVKNSVSATISNIFLQL